MDPPALSEEGAKNVPNQPLRRECSATRDFFDSQDIDKVGYFARGVKDGLTLPSGYPTFGDRLSYRIGANGLLK